MAAFLAEQIGTERNLDETLKRTKHWIDLHEPRPPYEVRTDEAVNAAVTGTPSTTEVEEEEVFVNFFLSLITVETDIETNIEKKKILTGSQA